MPAYRYYDCTICESRIDTDYDNYEPQECGCCFYCEECAMDTTITTQRRRRNTELVHSYSYKPTPYMPKGNYPTEVLMGVELEMGGDKYDIANAVKDIDPNEDHLYCKSDCSIYGTEIVTHPATLKWTKEYQFPQLLQKLRDLNCYVDKDECVCGDRNYCDHEYGLHIHVSRNAFRQLRKRATPETRPYGETYEQSIGRQMRELQRQNREQQAINHQMIWLMFLERNSDKLAGEYQLCRRDPSHYGAFKKSDFEELRKKATNDPFFDEGRYQAINCQNAKTYELRFFKSTVDTEEFFAAIEFADASVEFTRTLNANDVLRNRGLEWSKFVEFARNAEYEDGTWKYPNLVAQTIKCGIAN